MVRKWKLRSYRSISIHVRNMISCVSSGGSPPINLPPIHRLHLATSSTSSISPRYRPSPAASSVLRSMWPGPPAPWCSMSRTNARRPESWPLGSCTASTTAARSLDPAAPPPDEPAIRSRTSLRVRKRSTRPAWCTSVQRCVEEIRAKVFFLDIADEVTAEEALASVESWRDEVRLERAFGKTDGAARKVVDMVVSVGLLDPSDAEEQQRFQADLTLASGSLTLCEIQLPTTHS
ncbi:hypothetical protein DFJ74DRAFT_747065 [Hyaloraphidium curvatum]|nr:hypothetical protein DFJ74DRAFT_747065 [Hyaloraphidium curvatum]